MSTSAIFNPVCNPSPSCNLLYDEFYKDSPAPAIQLLDHEMNYVVQGGDSWFQGYNAPVFLIDSENEAYFNSFEEGYIYADATKADLKITCKVQPGTAHSDTAVGLAVRCDYPHTSNCYIFQIYKGRNQFELWSKINDGYTMRDSKSISVTLGQWYEMEVTSSGSTLSGKVNGGNSISYAFSEDDFESQTVYDRFLDSPYHGLFSNVGGYNRYDNFCASS